MIFKDLETFANIILDVQVVMGMFSFITFTNLPEERIDDRIKMAGFYVTFHILEQ